MKDVKEFVGYARYWARKLVNLEGFDVSQWKRDNSVIFNKHSFRACMKESQNLIQFLYDKFGTDEENEYFVTAWKYYVVIAMTQVNDLDFLKARSDLKIPELKKEIGYPDDYRAPLHIKFGME